MRHYVCIIRVLISIYATIYPVPGMSVPSDMRVVTCRSNWIGGTVRADGEEIRSEVALSEIMTKLGFKLVVKVGLHHRLCLRRYDYDFMPAQVNTVVYD
jgi:hypothetical protein